MSKIVELVNYGYSGCCELNIGTGELKFKQKKRNLGLLVCIFMTTAAFLQFTRLRQAQQYTTAKGACFNKSPQNTVGQARKKQGI